ncbi:hypothetical protein BM1374165_01458 [Bartonella henselae]|uniref:Uncharacterized protein n=1 Tax=Bartonella henselae TaxID=38323 RepID=X5MGK4_BARHN|nr:hypothetical protein BM1374165_01458 [Bartonella henselae]
MMFEDFGALGTRGFWNSMVFGVCFFEGRYA